MGATTMTMTVEQGATYDAIYTVQYEDGSLIDFTGATAAMAVKQAYAATAPIFTLNTPESGSGITLGSTAGTLEVFMTPAQTALLTVASVPFNGTTPPVQNYVYDLIVTFPTGTIWRIFEGVLQVVIGVTS